MTTAAARRVTYQLDVRSWSSGELQPVRTTAERAGVELHTVDAGEENPSYGRAPSASRSRRRCCCARIR